MKCEYGCGSDAIHKLKSGKNCCSITYHSCPVIRKKNSDGLKKAHKEGRIPSDQLDNKRSWRDSDKRINEQLMRSLSEDNGSHKTNPFIKSLMIDYLGYEDKCCICSIEDWNEKPITLQLDHIDGNSYNNKIDNLRIICPNCHSQTETFCGAGNSGKQKVSDDELVEAISTTNNIRQTLIKVRLTPKGMNYERVRNVMEKYNLEF